MFSYGSVVALYLIIFAIYKIPKIDPYPLIILITLILSHFFLSINLSTREIKKYSNLLAGVQGKIEMAYFSDIHPESRPEEARYVAESNLKTQDSIMEHAESSPIKRMLFLE